MTVKCRPLVTLLLAATVSLPSAFCQGLPPTNMGKFVHQPGDNQYQPSSQVLRHGTEGYLDNTGCVDNRTVIQRQAAAAAAASGPPAYTLAPPPPPGPDVSIEPIVAEEPVPPPGFPPLPIALDLPVSMGYGSSAAGARGSWKNSDNGGGSGGSGGSGGNGFQGERGGTAGGAGYRHYQPGAFVPDRHNSNGGGGGNDGGGGGGGGGGQADDSGAGNNNSSVSYTSPAVSTSPSSNRESHYYKVRTPPPIMRTDTFNTQTGGGTGKQAAGAATPIGAGSGAHGGKAPGLDDSQDAAGTGAPEAPAATGVFQTHAEDLTLPDDEYTSRYFKDSGAGRKAKQLFKQGKSFGRQMIHTSGVPLPF